MPQAIDTKLATALKQAKQTPMIFAFVAKGSNDGELIVSRKQIPTTQINEAKASCGGKLVFKGRCLGEEGKMIFELGKQPPAQLAKQLRQVIKESAGLALQVETRFVTDLVEDEQRGDEGQQDPTPTSKPPSPQEDAARLMARLKEVVAAVQKAAAANNPNAQAAKAAVAGLNELIKAKKYDEANAAIDKALGLLAQTGASSGEISPEALAQWQEALQAWQQASDAVDGQIAKLQAALKATADEDFVEIADKGLNALTGNYRVRLMVILREAQSSQGPAFKKLAGKGAALAKGFRDHLDSDERVEACDDNPFGVSVSIRPTLGAALAKLAGAFDAVSKA